MKSYPLVFVWAEPPKQEAIIDELQALDTSCRACEVERVDVELKLKSVKEELHMALAGGPSMGLSIQPRFPESQVS